MDGWPWSHEGGYASPHVGFYLYSDTQTLSFPPSALFMFLFTRVLVVMSVFGGRGVVCLRVTTVA